MILRFLPNRQIAAMGIADLLVVILFANAAQNAMSSDYTAITDGIILVLTIIFWNYLLNWLSYKFPPVLFISFHVKVATDIFQIYEIL